MYIYNIVKNIYNLEPLCIHKEWSCITKFNTIIYYTDFRLFVLYKTSCPTLAHYLIRQHNLNRLLGDNSQ